MWPFASYPTLTPHTINGKTYDYVIIGGGTAGCVLASRLSADPSLSVLVLEKGQVNDAFWTRIPLLSQNFRFPFMQSVMRRPEALSSEWGDLKLELWTGEALGGSSRINGMLLTRGCPGGYNAWAEDYGLTEWGWDRVEPYFRKSENCVGRPGKEYRGYDGPVENRVPLMELASVRYWVEAAKRCGLPVESDANDPSASAQGAFELDQTIDGKAQRLSAYRAWLGRDVAVERKGRLGVCTGVVASKLLLDDKGNKVVGVEIKRVDGGAEYRVNVRREVIVCSGALCSPQLLMLSGIGPKEQLQAHGIPVRRELDAVGRNLYDHTSFPVMSEIKQEDTLHIIETLWGFLSSLFLWLIWGTGLLAASSTPMSIFYRTGALDKKTMTVQPRDEDGKDTMDASQPRNVPNIEVMLIPINCHRVAIPGLNLFSWYTTLVQPFSSGRVELASTDPRDHPRVRYPLLDDKRDRIAMRESTRFSMHLAEEFAKVYPGPAPLTFAPGMDMKALDSVYEGTFKPAPTPAGKVLEGGKGDAKPTGKTWRDVTDDEIDEYAKRIALSSLHYSSTCRMSLSDKEGVVDQRLKVHGVENLRIADASVFPYIPSGHTMAPTIMVAERCADFLTEDWSERKEK
ncbi:hypothetical protein OQA88_2473 [Cercophora sp. LCS_1]